MLVLAQAAEEAAVNSVLDFALKGGPMMIPIGLCSLVVVAVVFERMGVLRRTKFAPRGFDKKLAKALGDQPVSAGARADAVKLCKKANHGAGRVMLAGLDKLGHGHDVVEKHLGAAGEEEVYRMRRRLRALTVVAAIAPLLGLTGTIFGMIEAFQTVATSEDALGKAGKLAGGIYEAMITTAAGLLVAIPTLVFYHWLAGRVEGLTRDLDRLCVWFVETYVLERKHADTAETESVPEKIVKPAETESVEIGDGLAGAGVTA
ncbi:MAG: MotA/TolQ/ExbB proton channel family protein [Planctomycetota bacterium]